MPRISIGDCSLYYEDHGSGEPLMLVPGLGGVGAGFSKQIPALSKHFRVIVHDHRGCGQSDKPLMRYSVEQMTGDVLKLMDALNISSAHYLGHSTGGAIGQIIAIEQPQRLKKLVLSSTWTHPDAYFTRVFEVRRALLAHLGPLAYARGSTPGLYPGWWVAQNEAMFDQQEAAQAANFPPVEVTLSRIDAIMRFDRRAGLGRISAPAMVTVSADDSLTPPYFAEAIAQAIPRAKLRILPRGGHLNYQVIDEEYNETMIGFLRD